MASGLYQSFRKACLDKTGPAMLTDSIKVVLIDTADYTVDLATHDFLNDVPAAARVGTPTALANKTTTNGVFDADDVVLPNVSGDQVEALIIYQDTGTESTSQLISYIDQGPNWPLTPNAGNVTVVWPSDANRIFKI